MQLSFLQSAEWEAFERSLGCATWRVRGVLIVRRDLPFGCNYLYCPRPDSGRWTAESRFWHEMREIARKERSIFLKIDPMDSIIFPASGVPHQASSIQPRETIVLDIADRTEDELLAAMHEKTRYNIRLAERKGVMVENFQFSIFNFQSERFETFWNLLRETAARDGFRTHPRRYYEKLLETRSDGFSNELFLAEYQGVVIAAAMVNFYRSYRSGTSIGTATYLHGASGSEHREVMAPHLLQWRMIQEAKKRGCAQYDFWGIDEGRWPGVTRFKRGFGGRKVAYPQSVNVVYRPALYGAYTLAKRIRKQES